MIIPFEIKASNIAALTKSTKENKNVGANGSFFIRAYITIIHAITARANI